MVEAVKSFLVINVSRIGDTLLVTPALRAIACAYPHAQITVMCHPKRAEILKNIYFVQRAGSITKKSAPWRARFQSKIYDYALVYGFDEALVAYALRVAKRVVAFRQQDQNLNKRLYQVVEVPDFQSDHSVLQLLRLPLALDIQPAGLRVAYQVSPDEAYWAKARLLVDFQEEAGSFIGLQVASFHTKSYRDWPIEYFSELAERLASEWPQVRFLIYGGTSERERTRWLQVRLGHRAKSYAGHLSLRQTAALMSLTDLYIGVDTGPTHIMAAFDIPLVGLYHCSAPSRLIGPLEHPYFYPVDHPRSYRCPTETPMAEISVETVLTAARRAFTTPRLRQATP